MHPWLRRTLLAASLAPALAGCSPALPTSPDATTPEAQSHCTDADPPADGKALVELGDGSGASFASSDGGATLELHHGPQGGQHVYVTIALFAEAPARWTHALAFVENGQTVGNAVITVDACGPGWTVTENARVVLESAGSHQGTLRVSSLRDGASADEALTFEVPISIVDPR
jgi:hypothetical protein